MRLAGKDDMDFIKGLIEQAALNTEDLDKADVDFLVWEDQSGNPAAVVGIENLKEAGLIRSLVFTPVFHPANLPLFIEKAVGLGRLKKYSRLLLGTDKKASADLFHCMGFQKVQLEEISQTLQLSTHGKYLMGITICEFMQIRL